MRCFDYVWGSGMLYPKQCCNETVLFIKRLRFSSLGCFTQGNYTGVEGNRGAWLETPKEDLLCVGALCPQSTAKVKSRWSVILAPLSEVSYQYCAHLSPLTGRAQLFKINDVVS